jgi:hypothetical protein
MFKFFKKKTKKELLIEKYDKLIKEAYKLSHTDRKASNFKQFEAEELMKEIEKLKE